jgi:ADP-ribosyl-[dinitrogen reductase] hydrolase
MRTAPVALAHNGDDEHIGEPAAMISALTHGDPLAGEACVLRCVAIDRAGSSTGALVAEPPVNKRFPDE